MTTPRPGGAVLMDGHVLGDEIVAALRGEVEAAGWPPVCLATVVVADDRASLRNAAAKHHQAARAGMRSRGVVLPASAAPAEVAGAVGALVDDPAVHGVFVQLPLPAGFDVDAVLDLVPAAKDVDGLSEISMGRLVRGAAGHVPATALGVLRLLGRYGVATSGRRAVVVGRTTYLARPVALLLARKGVDATVTLVDGDAPDLVEVCRQADIVVAAADSPHLIGVAHVRPGAAVVDAGSARTAAGLVGDVDLAAVRTVAGAIAPTPGGTGPVTIACLLQNTLAAARLQHALP